MTRLTIVLVRGAFAGGSSWSGVVERGSQPTGLCDRRQRRPSAAACTIERHSVANLVDLDRQDLVLTRALATVRLQPTFLVEATSPAVLSAYPGREETVASGTGIAATSCDTIVIGTPMDLRHVIRLTKPAVRVTYELEEIGLPMLPDPFE